MSRRPLVALLLVIGLASCGVEVFGSGGQTTLETTSSTSLATTTSIAPTTTAPTPTTEPVDACVQAEPVARVFLDLVEFAMKDWEPIAANQVSGAEAAALLAELRGRLVAIGGELDTASISDPQLRAISRNFDDLLDAFVASIDELQVAVASGANDPMLDDNGEPLDSLWRVVVLFETASDEFRTWLEGRCPDLNRLVDEQIAQYE